MKKKLSAALASTMVLGTVPAAFAATPNFVDISGSYAQQQILQLVSQGIINGEDATHFNPTGTLTRAEAAKLIVLATGTKVDATVSSSVYFTDVNGWAAPYVDAASKAGLFNGEGNGIFDPSAPLTREQAAIVLAKALGLNVDMSAIPSFTDAASISSWARPYVAAVQKAGLFNGNPDGSFGGQSPFTREQAAVVLVAFQAKYQALQAASVSKLSITGNGTVAVGQAEKLTAVATNAAGNAVANAVYSWSVSGSGAVIDANGNFIASQPGTYTVTVTSGGQTATANVVVFGQAAGVKLSAASTNVVANNAYADVITATVVDASGNTVTSFNGTASISLIGSGVSLPSPATVTFTNGVGTFNATSDDKNVGETATINTYSLATTNGSAMASNINYSSIALTTVAPTASKLAVAIASGQPATISANSQVSTQVTVTVEDATGSAYSGAGAYVTLTLTGPGTLVAGSNVTTETIFVTGTSTPISVYSIAGQSGTINVTATATGLTTSSLSVPTYINTAAAKLSITTTTGTDSNSQPYTTYTVSLLDTNGNPITGSSITDALSITDNTSTQGGVLKYGSLNTSSNVFTAGTKPTNLANGVATFTVENAGTGTSPVTITVTDTTNTAVPAATANYSYAAGPDSTVTVASASSVTNGNLQVNQTETFTAQLVDASGNSVSAAGKTVTFKFVSNSAGAVFPNGVGGTTSTYTATTNGSGVASLTVTVPSTATVGGTFQVAAQDTSANSSGAFVNGGIFTVVNTAGYATQLSLAGNPSLPVAAGATVSGITVTPENAVGTTVTGDTLQITSSNASILPVDSSGDSSTTLSAGTYTLNSVKAGMAGTATITVQDISNPSEPKTSFNVNVVSGAATADQVNYNGTAISSSNTLAVTANTPVLVSVANVDAGGNPVLVSGSSAQLVALKDTNGGSFRLTASGANVSEISIPAGQSSVSVYYVNPTTQTISSGISAANAVLTSVSATTLTAPTAGTTQNVTLSALDQNGNVDTGFTGTQNVTINGLTAPAVGTAYGTINNQTVTSTASTQTVAVSFSNGVATIPVSLNNAAAQTVSFTFGGMTTANQTVTPIAAAASSFTVAPATATIGAAPATTQVVTATVVDQYGNAVSGATVNWSVAKGTDAGTVGTLSATSSTTNAAGQATVTYTEGTGATGTTDVVTATVSGATTTAGTSTITHN